MQSINVSRKINPIFIFMMLTVFLFITLALIVVVILSKKRMNSLIRERFELIDKMEQIYASSLELQCAINITKAHSKQIKEKYECEINQFQKIVTGMHYYVDALYDRNLSQLNSQDLHCFIECYKEFDKTLFHWIEKNNIQLTNQEMAICVFVRMGNQKQEILKLLQCSDSSYRTIKNRIKTKCNITNSEGEVEGYIKALH